MADEFRTLAHSLNAAQITRRAFLGRSVMAMAGLGVASALLAACGDPDAPPDPVTDDPADTDDEDDPEPDLDDDADDDAEPEDAPTGGTIAHGSAQEPDRFWGPITGLVVSAEISQLTNGSLLKVNDELEFEPYLAEDVPTIENGGISDDGLTYTFHLVQGIHWHDGEPFTSADVRFTYEVIMTEGVDIRGRVGWNQISSVDTPDEHTAVFNFDSIDAPFLNRLAGVGILPEHILGGLSPEEINQHEWFHAPVGLGPFVFVEWVRGSHITLDRNPDYFKPELPHLDRIIYKIIPDANTLVNQLETGDTDTRVRMSNLDVGVVEAFPQVDVVSAPSVTPWLIWLNNNHPPLDELPVRQALAHGFDKIALCNELLQGRVEPAWGVLPPLSWAYNPDIVRHEYDPERAAAILDEAGWEVGNDGVREKDGERLTFEIMNIAGEQERIQILSFIQAQWRDIGVDARLLMVDVGTLFGNALPNREFEAAYSFIGRTADPDMSTIYLSPDLGPTANFAGYSNPEVDEMLLEALQTIEIDRRRELYFRVQEIVAEDVVYLFLAWLTNHTAINTRIQGYRPAPGYTEFWNADGWSVSG